MTLTDFIIAHNGTSFDFDGEYGAQCVDLARAWATDHAKPIVVGGGKDWAKAPGYTWIPCGTGLPQVGDLVVWEEWETAPYGHVAIAISSTTAGFTSFDQNWRLDNRCHIENHTFSHVVGWLQVLAGGPMDQLHINHIKVDGLEELFLNRELNDGDAPAIVGRAQIVSDNMASGMATHEALNKIVEAVITGAQGPDRQRLRDQFNYWLTLIP